MTNMAATGVGVGGDPRGPHVARLFWHEVESNELWQSVVKGLRAMDLQIPADFPARSNAQCFGTERVGTQDTLHSTLPLDHGLGTKEEVAAAAALDPDGIMRDHVLEAMKQDFPGDSWQERGTTAETLRSNVPSELQ